MRFMGTPEMPKPPTNKKDPFLIPLTASSGVWQILEKRCNLRVRREKSMVNVEIYYRYTNDLQ
jgi:hypothetical protein